MRQAGFSSRIPPAVGCQSTIYGNLMGRLCKEKGACVAPGEQSSMHQPDFLLCKWVVSQGALRCGTGEKQGSQALLAGGSRLQEWPFGHHTARIWEICVGSCSDLWQSIRYGRSWKQSTAIFFKYPLLKSSNPRSPDSEKWEVLE